MKQLLILSGKGGTGKTTVASAFIKLSYAKAYADCDVDAPNLHLIMGQGQEPVHSDFYGMGKAQLDFNLCTSCDLCRIHCRFDAIQAGFKYFVDPFACEGCAVCEMVCPTGAIRMTDHVAGDLMLYEDKAVFSTAQLNMGSGTSGKLVSAVKKQLIDNVQDVALAVIDGSPGIGCPVIASVSGVDMVLIVAEPSVSGISDMERIIETARHFEVKTAVCINKHDTNEALTRQIQQYCREQKLPYVGQIPYDPAAVAAINEGHSIVEQDCASGRAVENVYKRTMDLLFHGLYVDSLNIQNDFF